MSTAEVLGHGSSDTRSTASESLDSITSGTTFDLLTDLQDSFKNLDNIASPALPSSITSTVNKKRDRDEYPANSSDAPLFSSDDLPASSAENYDGPRVKRQHRRRWYDMEESWESLSASLSKKKPSMKGPFKRTHDSDVWLGNDESTETENNDWTDAIQGTLRVMESGGSIVGEEDLWSDDETELDGEKAHESPQTLEEKFQRALVQRALQITEDPGGFEGPVFPYWQKQPGHLKGFHLVQEQAQKKVTLCVEEGGEVVDLSYVAFSQHVQLEA